MADRTIRVTLVGDATSLIAAATRSREALNGLANVNIGNVRAGMQAAGAAANEATRSTTGWTTALRTGLAVVGLQAGFMAIAQGLRSVITNGLEYESNLNTLQAVTGASVKEMEALRAKAFELGKDLSLPGISAADAALGLKELAKGGLDAQQAMDAAKGTMQLATAAHVSGGVAATIQAKALQAFAIDAGQAGHVADLLANAANAASGEVTDMAWALQQAATVAHGVGATIDETTTTLALFAKNGVVGSDAGTSFKTMIAQLASPTKEQTYALRDLNVSMFDSDGRFRGMASLAGQLQKSFKRLSTEQYNQAAATAFGTDALRAANILGQEGATGFEDMANKVGLYDGAAKLAEAQTHGFVGALNAMSSNAESVSTQMYEKLTPALISLANAGNTVIGWIGALGNAFGSVSPWIQRFLLSVLGIIILKGPIKALSGAIVAGFTSMIPAFRTGTVGAVIAAGAMDKLKASLKGLSAAGLSSILGWLLVLGSTIIPMFFNSTEDAVVGVVDLTDVIDGATGALKENALQTMLAKPGISDMITRYRELGGAEGDWTMAIFGNTDAQERAHAVFQKAMATQLEASGALDRYNESHGDAQLTLDQFTTKVLDNKSALDVSNEAIDKAWNANADLIRITDQVNKAYADGADVLNRTKQQQAGFNTLIKDTVATTKEITEATKGVMDAYAKSTPAAYVFGNAIAAVTEKANATKQAMDYATAVLPGAEWRASAQAARDNADAFREVGAAARDYEKAAQGVKDAQQNLAETKSGSPEELKAITQAQKGVGSATEAASDAQKAYGKAVKDAAEAVADADKGVVDARATAAKDQMDAEKDLSTARKDAAKETADATDNLVQIRKDAAEKIKESEDAILKAQREALKDLKKAQEKLAEVQLKAAENLLAAQKKYNDELAKSRKSSIDLRVAQEAADAARAKAADETIGAQGSAQTAAFDAFAAAQDKLNALQTSGTATAYELAKAQHAVELSLKNPNLAKDLASAMDDLAKAQKDNTDNAKNAADARDNLGKVRKEGAGNVADAQAGVVDSKAKGAENISAAQKANAKAVEEGAKKIADAQASLADAVAKGADSIIKAQEKVAETSASGAKSIEDAVKQAAKAHENSAEQIVAAQKSVDDANQGVLDAQTALNEAQAAAIPTQEELAKAQWDLAAAQDAVWAAGDKQAASLDKAGQAARDAAGAAYAKASADGDLAAGVDAATATMEQQRIQFINTAIKAGYSADEAKRLADNQGLIPSVVKTQYENINEKAAQEFIEAYNKKIDELDGKAPHWSANGTYIMHFDWARAVEDFKNGVRGIVDPTTGKRTAASTYGDTSTVGGLAEGGFAGWVRGPGGGTEDLVNAKLSAGEFVVRAKQATKYAALLDDINMGRQGFAAGGRVGGGKLDPIVTATTVPVPDFDGVTKAWGTIGDTVDGVVKATITPAITKMDNNLTVNRKGHQDLLDGTVRPVWTGIGKTVSNAQTNVLTPQMNQINTGSAGVGTAMSNLLTNKVGPSWSGIGKKVADTWGTTIKTNYGNINTGTSGVATTLGTAKTSMDTTWSGIGTTITNTQRNHIDPAHTKVTEYTTAVGGFFTGIQDGTKKAAQTTSTDLGTINTQIDEFFAKVDKLAPKTTSATTAGASASTLALADGGMITAGTGPRADDVHVRASRGEYIVNARSTAKHRAELDRINYLGKYADGGYVTGKAGDHIGKGVGDAIIDGTQRAVSAGVARLFEKFGGGGTSTATGFNPSQDPSSFGWVRGQGMVPYSWQGHNFGSVAGGTQGLWNALLNQLVPLIPGGLNANIGGFEDRTIAGTNTPSFHSYGLAVDLNSDANARGTAGYGRTGMYEIPGTAAHNIASKLGMEYGGDWGYTDPMHFEIHVAPSGIKDAIAGGVGGSGAVPAGGGWFKGIEDQIKGLVAISDAPFAGLTSEQAKNARAIAAVAIKRGLGRAGVLVGEVTALTESSLINVAHGDAMGPSSTGLFQQMPPWGPYSVRMDPTGSAGLFYDALLRLDPPWTTRSVQMQAQGVEQSEFADGSNYARNLAAAESITQGLGYDSGGMLRTGNSSVYNGTGRPEAVLTDRQWSLANTAMNYVINNTTTSSPPVITVNARVFVGGRELMEDVRIEVDNSYVQLRTEISRQNRQEL